MNDAQIKQFLNSEAGRRMMKHFQDEVKAEKEAAKRQQEFEKQLRQQQIEATFGKPEHRNATMYKLVDGILCKVTTGDMSEVVAVELVRNTDGLKSDDMAKIKEISPLHYYRLMDNTLEVKPSDAFYLYKHESIGNMYEKAETLTNRPTPDSDPNWWQHYDSAADYQLGITKAMKAAGFTAESLKDKQQGNQGE